MITILFVLLAAAGVWQVFQGLFMILWGLLQLIINLIFGVGPKINQETPTPRPRKTDNYNYWSNT